LHVRFSSHFWHTVSTQPVVKISTVPLSFRKCQLVSRGSKKCRVPSAPAGPPLPKPLTPRIPYSKVTLLNLGRGGPLRGSGALHLPGTFWSSLFQAIRSTDTKTHRASFHAFF
jgi:hypothetical protein